MMARRKFSKEFKEAALRRLQGGQTAAEVARALEVHPTELSRWRREWNEHGARAFQGVGRKRAEESRVADLERKIGQQTREIDFLKRALQHVEEQRLLLTSPARMSSYRRGSIPSSTRFNPMPGFRSC